MTNERTATLVTGALGGLGTAIVDRLLDDGGEVVVCDRRAEDLPAWLERFAPDRRPRIEFHPVDLTKESQVEDLARLLAEERVHVDRLVNNAGVQGAAAVWRVDSKTWERVLRVNLFGTFYMTRAFSRGMVERGFGRIVNFASVYAYHPGPGQSPYAAAKAGIIGYTHSTALDLAPHGVTVNVIAPGLIWHDRLRGVVDEEVVEKMRAQIPAGRSGRPDEIAHAVAFLLSEQSAYITGQTIHVNGGLYLTG
jgi:NAD(P)-dependent dehydrogenase (short-subunit alcohol dehydrogenase family)